MRFHFKQFNLFVNLLQHFGRPFRYDLIILLGPTVFHLVFTKIRNIYLIIWFLSTNEFPVFTIFLHVKNCMRFLQLSLNSLQFTFYSVAIYRAQSISKHRYLSTTFDYLLSICRYSNTINHFLHFYLFA